MTNPGDPSRRCPDAARLGVTLDPWQLMVLEVALRRRDDIWAAGASGGGSVPPVQHGQLAAVDANARRHAVLQVIGYWKAERSERESGSDRGQDEPQPERCPSETGRERPLESGETGEDVHRHRTEPDDEARLVQSDDGPARLVEYDQEDSGDEQSDRRDDCYRCDEYAHNGMRGAAAHVLLAAEVVAKHPPGDAAELEPDDRNEEHADKHVHGHKGVDAEKSRTLNGEEDQKQGAHDRGQLLVSGASAGKEPSPPHRPSKAEPYQGRPTRT
jgi:hypothetical protein